MGRFFDIAANLIKEIEIVALRCDSLVTVSDGLYHLLFFTKEDNKELLANIFFQISEKRQNPCWSFLVLFGGSEILHQADGEAVAAVAVGVEIKGVFA